MRYVAQHTRTPRKKHAFGAIALTLALDILLAGGIVGGDYLYNYKLPHKLASANVTTAAASQNELSMPAAESASSVGTQAASWDWKFKDHFSDTVLSTATTYKSPRLSIELTQASFDSGILDYSENGSHKPYGTMVSYTLADIFYISDISCFQTAFADDVYGVGYEEGLGAMSQRMKAVLAVNGDSYSNNHHQGNGTIIRNGVVYRAQPSTEEICVLYRDGTMKTYAPDAFDVNQVVADGAWQSWVFGPSLLDESGAAKSAFLTWDYIRESHPRTAIGYYEPGHYCLLVVDGRQPGVTRGMFLEEMSQLFASLGCKAAYNLDGGHSSFMIKGADVASHPYKPNKGVSDGIFICDSIAEA